MCLYVTCVFIGINFVFPLLRCLFWLTSLHSPCERAKHACVWPLSTALLGMVIFVPFWAFHLPMIIRGCPAFVSKGGLKSLGRHTWNVALFDDEPEHNHADEDHVRLSESFIPPTEIDVSFERSQHSPEGYAMRPLEGSVSDGNSAGQFRDDIMFSRETLPIQDPLSATDPAV